MASKIIKGISIEIGGETKGLQAALQKVETQSQGLSKELKDINKLLKLDPSNVELTAQKKKVLAEAIESCEEKLKTLREAEKQVQRQFEKGEVSEAQVRALKREIVDTETEMKSYKRQADAAEKATDQFGDETDEAKRSVSGLETAVEKAGDGFTVFKGVIADLISEGLQQLVGYMKDAATYALQTGMDFEAGMSQVAAISGATGDELEELTEKAKEMGAKTKFSAGESAEAFNYMAMAGWKTEDMLGGIEGIMNLAAASGSDLATASDIVTDALTAMGYKASDAGRLADVMAAASSNANTNVEMMGETFKYAAPLAGALGYSMEDTAVAIGLMANAGIKGSQAGTSLRSMLTRLSTAPTQDVTAIMGEFGISLTDAAGNMKPFNELMSDMRREFRDCDPEVQTYIASTLAGQEAMSGFLAIINASDEDFNKLTTAVNGSEGAAKRMAETMQDNLAGDVEELGGAFDTLALNISEKFNGSLRDGVQAVTAFLSGESSITEMLNGVMGAFSQAGETFKTFLPQLAQMGSEMLTWLVNGLVTGLPTLMAKATELVTNFCSYIAQAAPNIVGVAGSLITSFVQGIFNFIPSLMTGAAQIVGSLAQGIQGNASSFVSKALDLLDGFADKLTTALPVLIQNGMNFITNLVKGLMQALPEFIARAPEIISKFANLINDNFPTILAKGVGIIWELIKGIIKAIPTLVKNIPKIITAIVDVWEAFNWLSLGKKCIDLLGKGIKGMWTWLKNIGKKTMESVTNVIKNLPQNLLNLGKSAASNLGNALRNGLSTVKAGAKTIFDGVVNFFKTLPSKLISIGKDIVKGLWKGISDMAGWVVGKIEGFGDTVLSGIKSFFGIKSPSRVFRDEVGKMLGLGMAEGIEESTGDVENAMHDLENAAMGNVNGPSLNGLSLERGLQNRGSQMAATVTAAADSTMLAKLDSILAAIKSGQVLTIDGKALVGSTAARYDNTLGQRRALAARGAI